MHELYELKEKLMNELKGYGSQELSAGSLEVIDKLAHATKNICKIIEASEEEGSSEENRRYSEDGGSRNGGSRSYRGGSYARGRYSKRDSMGRYTRAEDDMEDMLMELKQMMGDLPPEKQREAQKFVSRMEQMS